MAAEVVGPAAEQARRAERCRDGVFSLDDPNAITPGLIVYASRAAAWDHLDPVLPAFPEMPEGLPQSAIEGTG